MWNIVRIGGMRTTQKILVLNEETAWDVQELIINSIKINIKQIGWEDVNWDHLAQDSNQWRIIVKEAMSLWIS